MRGWLSCPVIGSGTEEDPFRAEVADREEVVEGDRLEFVIGEGSECLVTFDVADPETLEAEYVPGEELVTEELLELGEEILPEFDPTAYLGTEEAPPVGSFVSDTFTDVSGTNLDAHTGELGATWTKHTLSGTGVARISDANRLRGAVTGGAGTSFYYYASGTPVTAEFSVAVPFYFASYAGVRAGMTGRVNTTVLTHYSMDYLVASKVWRLMKMVEGSLTVLGEYAQEPGVGTTLEVVLQLTNAKKSVFIAGTERISSADNTITAAGRAGVVFQETVTQTTGIHLASLTATDYVAPSGGAQLPLSRRNRIFVP